MTINTTVTTAQDGLDRILMALRSERRILETLARHPDLAGSHGPAALAARLGDLERQVVTALQLVQPARDVSQDARIARGLARLVSRP